MTRGACAATLLAIVSLGLAVCEPALAKAPAGDFAPFAQCPRFTAEVELCLLTHVYGGEVAVGTLRIPIDRTLSLQGGVIVHEGGSTERFVGALDGQTLSRTPLPVPGGLTSIVNPASLPPVLHKPYAQDARTGLTAVMATTELVGVPTIDITNLENGKGTGIGLPVRIRLESPFLGGECLLGSAASPVTFELTTGATSPPKPNTPIQGRFGEVLAKDEFEFIEVIHDVLVDNAFAVPRAAGCGGSFAALLDPAIDAKLGLPSPAGHNTAILEDAIDEATTVGVIASER